jgi:FKBP-type peptidyl-prolyl cis-trans isomerase
LAGLEYGAVAAKLKEGEQATFFIPYNLAYGRASRGDIPPYAVVKYDISSFEIQTEQEQIEAFIATDSLTYTIQDSVYTADIIKSDGSGLPVPQAGIDSNVTVEYTGRFLDGTIFDSNESFSFTIRTKGASNSEVIDGWNRAVNGMRVGDKKVILLYSALGYGSAGNTSGGSTIPGYAILWFEIKLKSVN